MKVMKERIWIHKNEVLDSIRVIEGNEVKFYSHTYKVKSDEDWIPLVRFDNWDIDSHYDKYDEKGFLLTQKICQERPKEEIAELAKEFRKNLLTMDISEL